MDLLYLAHRIPYPPNKGDKLRSFRQLECLASRHRVKCACFIDDPADRKHVEALRAYCHDLVTVELPLMRARLRGAAAIARGRTVTESYYKSAALRRALSTWSAQAPFDAVVAFSSATAPYALGVPARRRVLDMCDVDSLKWRELADRASGLNRLVYATEARRLAAREREWVSRFDATILITRAEAARLPEGTSHERVYVCGNGVFLPPLRRDPRNGRRPVVGFVGQMDYAPNVDAVTWFVNEAWPRIHRHCPGAVFRIVGRRPTAAVRELGRRPGVEVTGEVDDVTREWQRLDVSVAPLRVARGLQNKVLEAMASALPVVVSPAGLEGIDAVDGRDLVVAESAGAIADAVIRLIGSASRRKELGASARRFVSRRHQWGPMLDRFERLVTGAGPVARIAAGVGHPADDAEPEPSFPPAVATTGA